ncbi:hypothetical protein GOV08_04650 [Candidatus Woesearchaeota archaeon]|nr:hypothetical protein [Candidatus Woesearchaeota archaeon]
MCFAPYISLSTFIIEFLLAAYFVLRDPKDRLNQFLALISFMLGYYQLNEFLICTTSLNIFARLAMITTAILPALGVTYALIMWRKKIKYYWHILIYTPAAFFITMFSLPFYYDTPTFCNTVFIQYPTTGLLGQFYSLYYTIYVVGVGVLFYYAAIHAKDVYEKRLLQLGMLGMLILIVPAIVFLQFLPSLYVEFPSVLCEFALLLAIELVVLMWYKEKHKIKF